MNTQNATHRLGALTAAEVDAVSGAAAVTIDMGLFGTLVVGDGCGTWTTTEVNGDGVLTTKIRRCPR
jgi:hypothetical protein